jgi:hypothetical protein
MVGGGLLLTKIAAGYVNAKIITISKNVDRAIENKTNQIVAKVEQKADQLVARVEEKAESVITKAEQKAKSVIHKTRELVQETKVAVDGSVDKAADTSLGLLKDIAFYSGIAGMTSWLGYKIYKRVYKYWNSDKPNEVKEVTDSLDKYWDVIVFLLCSTLTVAGRWRAIVRSLSYARSVWNIIKSAVSGSEVVYRSLGGTGTSQKTSNEILSDMEPPLIEVCHYTSKCTKVVEGKKHEYINECGNPIAGTSKYCFEHLNKMGSSLCTWAGCSNLSTSKIDNRCDVHWNKRIRSRPLVCLTEDCKAQVDVDGDYCVPCQLRRSKGDVVVASTSIDKIVIERPPGEGVGDSDSDDDNKDPTRSIESFTSALMAYKYTPSLPMEFYDVVDWLSYPLRQDYLPCLNIDCPKEFNCPLWYANHLVTEHFFGRSMNDFIATVNNPSSKYDQLDKARHMDYINFTLVACYGVPLETSRVWNAYCVAHIIPASKIEQPVQAPGFVPVDPRVGKIYRRAKSYITSAFAVTFATALLCVAYWLWRIRKRWKDKQSVIVSVSNGEMKLQEKGRWIDYPKNDPRRWKRGDDGSLIDTQDPGIYSKAQQKAAILKDPNLGMGSYAVGVYGKGKNSQETVDDRWCPHFAWWGNCHVVGCPLPHVNFGTRDQNRNKVRNLLSDQTVSCRFIKGCTDSIRNKCPFAHQPKLNVLAAPFQPKYKKKDKNKVKTYTQDEILKSQSPDSTAELEWLWSKKKTAEPQIRDQIDLKINGLQFAVKPTLTGVSYVEKEQDLMKGDLDDTKRFEVATIQMPVDQTSTTWWSHSVFPVSVTSDENLFARPDRNGYLSSDGIISISHKWHAEVKHDFLFEFNAVEDKDGYLYPKHCKIENGVEKIIKMKFIGSDAKVHGEHSFGVAVRWAVPWVLQKWPVLPGESTGEWPTGVQVHMIAKVPTAVCNAGATSLAIKDGFEYPVCNYWSVNGNCGAPVIGSDKKLRGTHIGGWTDISVNTVIRKNCKAGL